MEGQSNIPPTKIMQRLYKGQKSMDSKEPRPSLWNVIGPTLFRTLCFLLLSTSLFIRVIFYISLSKTLWTVAVSIKSATVSNLNSKSTSIPNMSTKNRPGTKLCCVFYHTPNKKWDFWKRFMRSLLPYLSLSSKLY